MTLVCKSVGIVDGIVNPIDGCGVKMAPDINPIYAGLGLVIGIPKMYVDVGLVKTWLDLIESWGWVGW